MDGSLLRVNLYNVVLEHLDEATLDETLGWEVDRVSDWHVTSVFNLELANDVAPLHAYGHV